MSYGNGIEMITGIDTKTLKEFKEMAERQAEYYKRALKIRAKVMEEVETKGDIETNKFYEPEKYYNFRYKDKAIEIVKTNRTDINGKIMYGGQNTFYAIACYGWQPRRKQEKEKYDVYKKVYGAYNDLEQAEEEYKIYVADLLYQIGYDMYEDLDLFI